MTTPTMTTYMKVESGERKASIHMRTCETGKKKCHCHVQCHVLVHDVMCCRSQTVPQKCAEQPAVFRLARGACRSIWFATVGTLCRPTDLCKPGFTFYLQLSWTYIICILNVHMRKAFSLYISLVRKALDRIMPVKGNICNSKWQALVQTQQQTKSGKT